MSLSLPTATEEALQALTKALSKDHAHLKAIYGTAGSNQTLDVIISAIFERLKGARDMAVSVSSPSKVETAPVIEMPVEVAIAATSLQPASQVAERQNERPLNEPKVEPLTARERGILVDEAILRLATEHQRLFSIDEVLDMLSRAGLETPRGSLVTKLSRMVDARILQRAFRGAYEAGGKAVSELERVQRWRSTRI